MSKYLIVTNMKSIPYREILKEISPSDMFFLLPEMLLTAEEKSYFSKEGIGFQEVANYLCDGIIEKVCCDIHKWFPFNKIIANTEKDLLWAARVRELLKIEGQSYSSALVFRDKFIMKSVARKQGIKTPHFAKIESASDLLDFSQKERFPFIVKPCRDSLSIGVHLLKNEGDLENFIRQNLNIRHEANWIAENYVQGEMYQIDGIIKDGKVELLWPSKSIRHWLDITAGQIVGKYFLEPGNPFLTKLNEFAENVVSRFPVEKNTIFHLEFFYEKSTNDLVFCEIASRVGGLRGRNIWINGFGIDIGAEFIRAQAGLPFTFSNAKNKLPTTVDGYLLFPIRNGRLKKAPEVCKLPGVKEYKKLLENEKTYQLSQNLSQLACVATLSADSEVDFMAKAKTLADWYENEFEWASI